MEMVKAGKNPPVIVAKSIATKPIDTADMPSLLAVLDGVHEIAGNAALKGIVLRLDKKTAKKFKKLLLTEEHRPVFASAWNWVDAYLRCTHGEASDLYHFLRQAMAARRALLLSLTSLWAH